MVDTNILMIALLVVCVSFSGIHLPENDSICFLGNFANKLQRTGAKTVLFKKDVASAIKRLAFRNAVPASKNTVCVQHTV